jgi:hypothetical protein
MARGAPCAWQVELDMPSWDSHESPRPCGSKGCPYPERSIGSGNRGGGGFCGEHEGQEPPPEVRQVNDPVDEQERRRAAARPGADPFRTEDAIRAAMGGTE